jgi:hypothetical protein
VPYIYDPNLDEDNQQQQQSSDGSSVSISGASPTVESNAQSQGGSNTSQSQGLNTGSGFTNLDKYLQTNNSQEFGNKVLGKVGDQVQNAQTQMNQAADSFKQKVDGANANMPNEQQINSAIANPTSVDAKTFQGWENQQYAGPKSLGESQDDWNKYWSGVQNAQTNTQMLGSDSGRFTLLDQYFGKPSYNYGEKSLDNLLFQQSGLGDQTQSLQNQATQLQTQGNDQAGLLQGMASTKAGQVNDNRSKVLAAIGLDENRNVLTGANAGAIGKQYSDVDAQVAKANAERAAQVSSLRQGLAQDSLSSQDMARLGLSEGQNLYGVDLTQYLSAGSDLSRDQVMTPQQRAYIQALSQMAGVSDTFASGLASDPGAAFRYDTGGLQSAINGAKSEYERALQATPITYSSTDGSQQTQTLQQLEQQLAQAQGELGGNDADHYQRVVNILTPVINQAKQNINKKYNVGNTLKRVDQTANASVSRSPSVFGNFG